MFLLLLLLLLVVVVLLLLLLECLRAPLQMHICVAHAFGEPRPALGARSFFFFFFFFFFSGGCGSPDRFKWSGASPRTPIWLPQRR